MSLFTLMYVLFNNGKDNRRAEERRAINTVKKLTASEREKSNVYYTNKHTILCVVCVYCEAGINNVPLQPPKSKVDLFTCPNENCMSTLQTEEESPWHSPHDQRKIALLDERHWKADSTKGWRPQHVLRTKLQDAGLPRATWHPGTPQPPQPYATGPKSIYCIRVKFILWNIKVFYELNSFSLCWHLLYSNYLSP